MKRIFALLLCVLILAALFPVSALAEGDDPCADGHSPAGEGVVTPPSCTAAGYTTYTCAVCNESYRVMGEAALGHSYNDGITTLPSCTTAGFTTYTCTRCNDIKTEAGAAALGHSYDDGITTLPTCTTAGFTTYTCTRCNDIKTEAGAAALGHSYDDGIITTEPTFEEDGIKTFTCNRCSDSYTEAIPKQVSSTLGALQTTTDSEAKNKNDEKTSISDATIATIINQIYSHSEIEPDPTVTLGTSTLVKDTDFEVTYANNVNVGTATITVTGKGNYTGTISGSFEIVKKELTIKVINQTYVFDNNPHGEGDPAYTDPDVIAEKVSITGLAEGDSVTSIVLSGQATAIGVYPGKITATSCVVGDGVNTNTNNYNISCEPGTLTIRDPATEYTVTVTANPTGGGNPTANPLKGTFDTEIILTPAPATGYRFKEWQVVSGGVTITDNKFKIGTADVSIKAVFVPTVTVTFNANGHGTAPSAQTIDKGGKPTKPADLTAKGWIFDGWYTAKDGKTPFDFTAAVNENTTVYAKWTEIVYTVTKGEYNRWWKGGYYGISITVKRSPDDASCHSHFTGVMIDGSLLSSKAYSHKSGSTVIDLYASTLQSLHRGTHDITILFDDGYADAYVRIYTGAPKTDDNNTPGTWIALLLLSGCAFGGLAVLALKKPKKAEKR